MRHFADPAPARRIALCWRRTSVHRELLPAVAGVVRDRLAGLALADVRIAE